MMRKSVKAVFAAVSSLLFLGAMGANDTADAARKRKRSPSENSYSQRDHDRSGYKQQSHKKYKKKSRKRSSGKSFKKAADPVAAEAKPTEHTQDYFEKYGLPVHADARSLQRLLHMAGYEIGQIDGRVREATLEQGIRKMLVQYQNRFSDLFEGDATQLTEKQLVELIPAVYQRVARVGILNLRNEPQRWVMFIRAVDSSLLWHNNRTTVHGEFIIRAPDGREAFVINKNGKYSMEVMTRKEWDARKANGETIFRPQFNTGGLNYGKIKRSGQAANLPWNPYPGSALPGLAGGTVYGLTIRDGLINAKKAPLPRSFADLDGYKSWITIDIVDQQVVNKRNGFGIHVDGKTVTGRPNDGTAGCLGVHEEYARVFFEFIKQMTPSDEPSHFIVIPPTDPHLQATQEMKEFYESLFGVPDRAIRSFEKFLKSSIQ